MTVLACGAQALPQESVKDRMMLDALAYRSTTEFCLVTRNGGDKAALKRLKSVLAQADDINQTIGSEWPAIKSEWDETRNFMSVNETDAVAGNVVRLMPSLKIRQEKLYQAIKSSPIDSAGLAPEDNTVLTMLGSLERMLASYIMYQTNMFGGHAMNDVNIEAESQQFEQALAQLADEKLKAKIERKWHFVKDAFLAYNEKSAVFIVDRTSRTIRDLLLDKTERPLLAAE